MSSSEDEDREVPMLKNRIRFSDMPSTIQEKAIRLIHEVNQRLKLDKDIATEIKRQLDNS